MQSPQLRQHSDHSPARTLAMFISPLALPNPRPLHRRMPAAERLDAKRTNRRHVQRYIGVYIDRSARGLVGFMVAFFFASTVFGSPLLTALAGIGILVAVVHVAVLLFWKQHLDDLLGPVEPRD